jgi:uncharacterized protein YqgV (UPF0045/DUF77 family)
MVAVTGQSPSPDAPQNPSVLEAVLERITYANEDTGYTIARVATERTGPDLLTVVGPLLGAQVGESLRLTGRWSSHPRYGRQFEVHSYTTVLPATIQGIRRYLGSGLIKGIGPVMAERMVVSETAPRVSLVIKIDHHPGVANASRHKVESVERRLAGTSRQPSRTYTSPTLPTSPIQPLNSSRRRARPSRTSS